MAAGKQQPITQTKCLVQHFLVICHWQHHWQTAALFNELHIPGEHPVAFPFIIPKRYQSNDLSHYCNSLLTFHQFLQMKRQLSVLGIIHRTVDHGWNIQREGFLQNRG